MSKPFWPPPAEEYPGRLPDKADVVVIQQGRVVVAPGHGDGTFGDPLRYVTAGIAADPEFVIAADLDGNGTVDVLTSGGAPLVQLLNRCASAP